MRRRELFGLGGVLLVSACAAAQEPEPKPARGDLLAVDVEGGLAVLETGTGRRVVTAGAALPTPDGTRLVSVAPDGGTCRVVTHDAGTGRVVAETSVRGQLRLAAVAADAGLVALVGGDPAGRRETTVVVAGPAGERHRLTLPGFVQPEAFSASGTGLFVLDMLPPEHPDRYRVRVLDLAAGRLSALNLPGENAGIKVLVPRGAEEEMRGEGRQAVYDPDRQRLFTLYSHQPDHQHVRDLLGGGARDGRPDVHAFVHTLSVRDGWAVCVDLPATFGTGPVEGLAIARSGDQVWVVDAGTGGLATIMADVLVLGDELRFEPVAGRAALAVTPDGTRVLIAAGNRVVVVDTLRKAVSATWTLPDTARGIAAGGRHIYVGQPGAVVRLDPASGAVTATVAAPGLTAVRNLVG